MFAESGLVFCVLGLFGFDVSFFTTGALLIRPLVPTGIFKSEYRCSEDE